MQTQTTYRGTQLFSPAQWGGPIPRIISNIPSCLAQGSQGFYHVYPEHKFVFRYKHVKRLAYPTAFYLKSEWDSD